MVCAIGACAGACHPGDVHCGSNQTPETCSPQGQWVSGASPCPNVCSGQGMCTGNCKPGSNMCSGLTITTCDQNGNWVLGMTCPNICSSGSCGGSCMPGLKRCGANQTPETCSLMGTWEPAASACTNVCSGQGDCTGVCKPNAQQCAGLTPQVCDSNGTWKDAGTPCPNLCAQGACMGQCPPGTMRCVGLVPQVCSQAGSWQAQAACPNVCSNGMCTGMCKPGTKRCSSTGSAVQTCSDDGSIWNETMVCGTCRSCSASACTPDNTVGCGPGNQCVDGICKPTCGGNGQDCCNGTTCNQGFACKGTRCAACGGYLQQCCHVNTCTDPKTVCAPPSGGYILTPQQAHDDSAVCSSCGSQSEFCCLGFACGTGFYCVDSFGSYCDAGRCGGASAVCCINPNGQSVCDPGVSCVVSSGNISMCHAN